MLRKNEILRIYGTDYKEITIQLLREADLASLIPSRTTKIGLKPNLVSPTPASFGATTHPEILAGIIEYLKERGFHDIVIAEGSWVGDRTSESFKVCGYEDLSREYGVPLIDTQKERSYTADCSGMELRICRCVKDIGFLINIPVLKGHCQTRVTCALKNMKGLIPNSEKRHFHAMGLHAPIAHLSAGIHQDFIVVDHICGDLDFEDGGNPVVRNCVMAARDPVLTDAYACRLLHYEPEEVPYIPLAASLGIGSMDLDRAVIRTIGEGAEEALPSQRRIVGLSDAVCEVESCSACYGYLIPALQQLRDEGLLGRLEEVLRETAIRTESADCSTKNPDSLNETSCQNENASRYTYETADIAKNVDGNPVSPEHGYSGQICIGQGWRGKSGAVGIGNCTSGFDFCVRGCPPTEHEIYTALKEYISVH